MPKPGRKKRVRNPDNHSQFVPVPIIDEITLTFGSGAIFRKEVISFRNDGPGSTRKVQTKTITHLAKNEDGSPAVGDTDDPTQRLVAEIIDTFTIRHGSGPIYENRTYALNQDSDTNQRKTHVRRIKSESDPNNAWIDMERTDKTTLTFGSGPIFQRMLIELTWDDEAFDNADVPIDDGDPDDGFDPPWRFDPFQKPVNVKWSGPTQVGCRKVWSFQLNEEGTIPEARQSCSPIEEDSIQGFLDAVAGAPTDSYSFPEASFSPGFVSGLDILTESDFNVTGAPIMPPGDFLAMCVTVFINYVPLSHVLTTHADMPMVKYVLEGDQVCYGNFEGASNFGIIPSPEAFTVPIEASGINAVLRGKSADRISTRIDWAGGQFINITVDFSWDVPAGFDFSSGDPLP